MQTIENHFSEENCFHYLMQKCHQLNLQLKEIPLSEGFFSSNTTLGFDHYQYHIEQFSNQIPLKSRSRFLNEYFKYGPLHELLNNPEITEIMIHSFDEIWLEQKGQIIQSPFHFFSDFTYSQFLQRLYIEIKQEPSITFPFINATWNQCRLHIVGAYQPFTHTNKNPVRITLRKPNQNKWTLSKLKEMGWANDDNIRLLKSLIINKFNIIVIGPTNSGKTSVLQAIINEFQPEERAIIIEDTPELIPPNGCGARLTTRHDSRGVLPEITITDLIKESLRMRPDRLIVGEVRGPEAKDLLLALSTGHAGSAGTLHASNPQQALLRLEMLIQMGASQWSLMTIRRLLFLSLHYIVVCQRLPSGVRQLGGVFKVVSLEDSGLILEAQ